MRSPRPDAQIAKALAGLKDFQRRTVDYVFRRMYEDLSPAYRMLVSDEVGLGKTLVARGLVARALEHLWGSVERIDVVYICSNTDIARQNVRRLEFLSDGDRKFHLATRLTLLASELDKIKTQGSAVNFIALTPGTSFELTNRLGVARERAHLYWLLRLAWSFGDGVAPKNLLQGTAGTDGFRTLIDECRGDYRSGGPMVQQFKAEIDAEDQRRRERGEPALREEFDSLCEQFGRARIHAPHRDLREQRADMVGRMRSLLARACVRVLSPDVVILDEFQRFKHLLSGEDDASLLARALFDYSDANGRARVVLISATPYKMLTLSGEADEEDHYADFLDTLRFLAHDERKFALVRQAIDRFRLELLRLKRGQLGALKEAKRALEAELRKYIARTERLAATRDRSGMLVEVTLPTELRTADLDAYLAYQSLAEKLGERDVVEYWKSTPYLVNFLEGYKLRERLREAQEDPELGPAVAKVIAAAGPCMLTEKKIKALVPIEPMHSRLRAVERDCVESAAWRMLWIPPSLSYYLPKGAFADPKLSGFTKRLVFSAWRMVPRSVSTVLSHMVECDAIAAFEARRKSTGESKERWPSPLLRFSGEADGRLTGMAVFTLLYPGSVLARRFDPALYASRLWKQYERVPSRDEVMQAVCEDLKPLVSSLTVSHGKTAQVDERWYWAIAVLLDYQFDSEGTREWLAQTRLSATWVGELKAETDSDSKWAEHVALLQRSHRLEPPLGTPPEDLASVVAAMALGAPGIAALRALQRGSVEERYSGDARNAAARIGWAMRNLFNLPDSIAILRGQSEREPYWLHVLEYCGDGCLQAVMDEYVHVLREGLGIGADMSADAFAGLAEGASGAIGIRPAGLAMDDIRVKHEANGFELSTARLRSKFAMAFLDFKAEDTGTALSRAATGATRAEKVREAFNSPFWPFVLVTTSVGQEGLDFHPYCHAVVHWNLPSNPVDLEQREGRVHRYKGHAVRKNVAATFATAILDEGPTDPWTQVFAKAYKSREPTASDLVPFWLYPVDGGARIERHIVALPLSREQIRLRDLRRTLAVYRMVFGQPRQDDLIEYLLSSLPKDELTAVVAELRVDLSPPLSGDSINWPLNL